MRRILITALAAAAVSIGGVAQAAKPTTIKATPSTACSILTQFGAVPYSSFGECMGHLHRDVAAFRFPSDADPNVPLSLNQRCAQFEDEFLTYPFTFEEGPDWPFPTLTAQNRRQCMITLYTYHARADALGGG